MLTWEEMAKTADLDAYIPKSGATGISGNLEFANSGTAMRGIQGNMAGNDQWRVMGGATASNAGFLEIATADDNNEPIYVRQYKGVFSQLIRTLTLLDANGNTLFPGNVSANQIARDGYGKQWFQGRDGALIRITSSPAAGIYYPLASVKTTDESWEIGAYTKIIH